MADLLTLLILADREADAAAMAAELRRTGFTPAFKRVDNEPAYLAALDSRLDVILVDHPLTYLPLPQALHHLQANGRDVPVIVVTGAMSDQEATTFLQAGAADYVPREGLGRLGWAVRSALDASTRREQQRRVQEALRDSEERTRLIIANALDAVITIDMDGRIISWNPQAEQLFGWSAAEVLQRRLSETIVPPAHREAHERGLARFRETGEGPVLNRRMELSAMRRDGTEFPIELTITPLRLQGATVFSAFLRDITELKRTRASLAKSTERLQILHQIDRALIAAQAPADIAETVLPRLRDLLGVPRAIVNLFDLAAGEVEWLAAAGRHRVHVGPGVRFPLTFMGDVEALRRGDLQVIDVAALPRGPEAGALLASGVHTYMVVPMIVGSELIGAVSFGGAPSEFSEEQVNIAREAAAQLAIALEQARLYERVKRQAEELEQRVRERTLELTSVNEQLQREISDRRRAEAEADRANRAKSDFLSRMSHELRTPLNAILGFGQLLEARFDQPQDVESLDQILKGGRHLLTLINEVLDIARIEAGRLSMSPEPVQVGEAVKRVVDLARPLALERRLDLQADGAACYERYVLADSQRLQQVLLNLVSNGIKYNREGGRVTVACQAPRAGRLRLSVTDTGPGIPAPLQSRLFTPFDRLGVEVGSVEGTGLGLALCKHLVEAMGGAIGVESVAGQGSVFWFELPETASPEDHAGLGPPRKVAAFDAALRRGTVLYIEDNPSNLRLVARVLVDRTTYRFLSAMQGQLGLSLAREHRPDLILADLHLPDMSGEDVLRAILGDPELQHIPVIILSADATPRQIKRLLAAGARAYLTKPLDIQQLLTLIDATIPAG